MKLPKARHDALFRLLVSDPARTAVLLRDYLPSEVVARLDPDRLPVHVEGTAIDGEGFKTQADAIFRLYLRDGDEIIVYALLEHKAQNDIVRPISSTLPRSPFTTPRPPRLRVKKILSPALNPPVNPRRSSAIPHQK
ncbi:Rpn family recombination-promoting nuclease/putative transposase [Ruegeria sp.]|uniref:Rpn family recombination-promoting nuclease/putative transposase n=1 Tax=Ruegeria sp. TaxID=1879320 RepID=UPI003C7CF5C3